MASWVKTLHGEVWHYCDPRPHPYCGVDIYSSSIETTSKIPPPGLICRRCKGHLERDMRRLERRWADMRYALRCMDGEIIQFAEGVTHEAE
jgi:hypothetical protein